MRTPEFWYPQHGSGGVWPWLLAPFAGLFLLAGSLRRLFTHPYRPPVPVLCIGNLIAGGSGKTPTAIALGKDLAERGHAVHFLTRGYGGRLAGPVQVDIDVHQAADVGDEALLLARSAPTWVARDRAAGARAAVVAGAQLLIMDDGYQNPGIVKDVSLLVIDAARAVGNGWPIPAGPMRETLRGGLRHASAIILVGEADCSVTPLAAARNIPVLHARKVPDADGDGFHGHAVHAFCGLGAPEQFFQMLRDLGADLVGTASFPDHHPYTEDEFRGLLKSAGRTGGELVTTEKDFVRLWPGARQRVRTLGITMRFSEPQALERILASLWPSEGTPAQ